MKNLFVGVTNYNTLQSYFFIYNLGSIYLEI